MVELGFPTNVLLLKWDGRVHVGFERYGYESFL